MGDSNGLVHRNPITKEWIHSLTDYGNKLKGFGTPNSELWLND
jgi:hypothetical protein